MSHTDLESLFTENAEWPPDAGRVREYKENLHIRDNDFDDIWPDLNRLLREDNKDQLKTWLGYFWKSTIRSMDFLLGKPVMIGSSDAGSAEDLAVKQFAIDSDIHQTLFEVMVDCDSLGDGLLKIYKDAEGKAVLQSNCPLIWNTIVEPGNLRRVQYHVLATKFKVKELGYLKVEIHSKNDIQHRIYELKESVAHKTCQLGKRMPFELFAEQFPGILEIETHGMGEFLVIPISNIRTSKDVYGKSSYNEAAKSIAKKLIDRYNQIDRVLDKHSDPNMIGPKGMMELNPITHKPMFRGGGRYFGYQHDPNMTPPRIEYVTWDGNLVPAETAIQRQIGDLFNELELPPVAMASKLEGAVVSGTAYRLMLTPLLAKVGRLERAMIPQATKAIKLAMRYQGLPIEDVMVKTQSAMPVIPLEESQRIAALAASGIFMGEAGTQYLLEQAGVDPEMAATIAKESGNQQIGAF
jgi:hypothetical protein